jgi:hypothetical protein
MRKIKLTKKQLVYVCKDGTEYTIPQGTECIQVPGLARIDGQEVENPWCVHFPPRQYMNNEHFLEYSKKWGIIISSAFLVDAEKVRAHWDKKFKVYALSKGRDTGTLKNGDSVPPEAILQWANEFVSSAYYQQYTPADLLKAWLEAFEFESENKEEYAAEVLYNCEWELKAALEKAGLWSCFSLRKYWDYSLQYDTHELRFTDGQGIVHFLYVRANW